MPLPSCFAQRAQHARTVYQSGNASGSPTKEHWVTVGKDLVEDVGNVRIERTASDRNVTTGGHYTHRIEGRHDTEAGERITQRTRMYELYVAERLEIHGPGGSITLDDAGVTIEGFAIQMKGPVEYDPAGSGNALTIHGFVNAPIEEPKGPFSGRYLMIKDDDRSFVGYGYRVVEDDRLLAEGKTDEEGGTAWIDTPKSQRVQAYKTVMREDQCITEDWESRLGWVDQAGPIDAPSPYTDEYLSQHSDEGEA